MKILLILFFFSLQFISHSQIVFEKTKHDFGDLTITSDRYVDIIVTNKGTKKEFLLSVKKPANVVYLVNGQFLEKDDTIIVRLQVNQKEKGRFSYEVQIYTSDKDEPTIIKLTGNVTETGNTNANALQNCPDFNSTPQSRLHATDFELTVVTIDKITRKLLEKSKVTIIQNGIPLGQYETDKKGEVKQKLPLGFTYFYATHEGYYPKELGNYVNIQSNFIILELEKKPVSIPIIVPVIIESKPEVIVETKPVNKPIEIVIPVEEKLETELAKETVTQTSLVDSIIPLKFSELDKDNFDATNFKPINVTFILDVSGSMAIGEKMELMKFSLYQLTDMLRPQDQISIVTYATDTRVILPITSGSKKEEIKKLVESIKANGSTAGGEGIKLGYQQALKGYLPEGTNQVIIITDGAFSQSNDDYKKYIKKYKKKGINMSVVGILNKEREKKSMQEVAELAGGRYIPINKLVDAMNNLKQEIRFICFKE